MGGKHEVLTEAELASFKLHPTCMKPLDDYLRQHPEKKPEDVNVLDWGCGRGRAVAKLREKGFNAFGVEIDRNCLSKGFPIFESRGLSPDSLLRPLDEINSFPDGYFDCVFSQQVFEHVRDLAGVIEEQSRLTAPGGIGIHCFPASKNVWEAHLNMPLVHWLPKSPVRKLWIAGMLNLSYGPKTPWPAVDGKSSWEAADVYYRYANEKTYYRDSKVIQNLFESNGFSAKYSIPSLSWKIRRFLPDYLRRNGFPRGTVVFVVRRHGKAQPLSEAAA